MKTRAEHLQWCKDRAIEYVQQGDVTNAAASFMSDMDKHDETRNHAALKLMATMLFTGQLNSPDEMRKFILGFN